MPAATRVLDQVAGKTVSDPRTFAVSLNELKQSLAPVNEHLALRNFLVGYQMTIADAHLVSVLSVCFSIVLDKKTRDGPLLNVARYANIILKMAPCVRVFGNVVFCKDPTNPDFNAKPVKAKKEGSDKPQQQ